MGRRWSQEGYARTRRQIQGWIASVFPLSNRAGQDYNVPQPVDLNSSIAARLRTELESALAETRGAKVKLDSAREINEDGSFHNPDGAYAHRVAAHEYRSAVEKYRQALTAWVNHLLDS
jgi:hypothetical protein